MQLYLAAAGIFQFCWMYSYLPETAQPGTRGIDKLPGINSPKHHPRFIFINPLQPLALLRSPNLLFIVSTIYGCVLSQAPKHYSNFIKSIIASSSLMNFFCTSCGIYFPICRIHEYGNSASCPIALHYRKHILFFLLTSQM